MSDMSRDLRTLKLNYILIPVYRARYILLYANHCVALTHLAGGNSALALAVTVASNLLGILTIPFWVSRYIAGGVGVSFPTDQLFRSLIVTLLIPLIIGKVIRETFKGFTNFVDNNRKLFSRMNATCLSLVPWIQVSRSRSLLLSVGMIHD
ncbi:probable sodium/metabolite cotransporter BASS4, chloroplastic [Brassica rapa]|uniref:probable sodium/metabolite cotransporter BASS4, chloroplastic n=1 Tax=Brassica campestris TaxID=3711 RepID=UPI00142E3388|nr:probable sodium/metabolite cotransporter BASS4, chloroplastic [Brassica rapa]